MPPRWRNHRDPTSPDTPTATAASSLLRPSAILAQNARSTSRRGGRPGDRIGARPVFVDIHAAVRLNATPLLIAVLRRPLESAQYTSIAFMDALEEAGIAGSIGSVGDAPDNALMESTIGLYKTELIKHPRRRTTWKSRVEVEAATAEWVQWYNTERIHSSIRYMPPIEKEMEYASTIASRR